MLRRRRCCVGCCCSVIEYLHTYFQPGHAEPGHSLAIQGGSQGARLTHSHERQFTYCLQSLTLWREISHEVRCGAAVRLRGCVATWLGVGKESGGRDAGRRFVGGRAATARPVQKPTGCTSPTRPPPPHPPPTHTHTHTHTTTTCSRSLTQMFKLWFLADSDLLREGNRYTLTNTGQGLNRVQGAPSGVCGVRRAVECAAGEGWGQRRPGG